MPDVRNCRRCGKIYNYIGGPPICPACRDEDEADFRKIKEYLYQYPGATLSEVSSVLKVSVEKIRRFLREGRLEIINEDGNIFLDCERCGKSIKTGRFCANCEKEVSENIKSYSGKLNKTAQEKAVLEREKQQEFLKYINIKDGNK